MAEFKKGDVVVLRSGGPKMTVVELGDYSGYGTGPKDGVKCQWFDKTKRFEDVFDAETLKIYTLPAMGIAIGRG
ncbi:YodC family protein [Pseudomonas moraviensis]|uniref:YodC family protein n=1 Tax=Pseudomonas moraviensis TaxID=321662 RepID=UPI00087B82A4|nr:DUF2158 domain-containing protein [Pseudomonas moraviensis]SDU02041.1 Uncharacterized conserved protein YodC, DUF2158 family [Pseudomonas moraviensis]